MKVKIEGTVFLDGKRGKKVSDKIEWMGNSFDRMVEEFVEGLNEQYSDNHTVDEVFVDRITVIKSNGGKR